MMDSFNVMVVQANSEPGLEFVKQLASLPYPPEHIFATYSKEENLKDLNDTKESSERSKIILIKLDIQTPTDIGAAKERIEEVTGKQSLNILINTMRFADQELGNNISQKILEEQFQQYTLPSLLLFQTMVPLLEARSPEALKSVFLNVIEDNSVEYNPLFEINKIALNLALDATAERMANNDVLVFSKCINAEENFHDKSVSKREKHAISILLHVLWSL